MKECTKCGTVKTVDQYYVRRGKDRPNPRYMSECKECHKASQRRRNLDPERKTAKRGRNLMVNYGITLEQYSDMYAEQNGECFVCGEKHPVLHVDHNHETGEVRKLLCTLCNTAFGKLREDVTIIQKLLDYGRMYDNT